MAGGQKGRVGGAVTHGNATGGRSKEYRAWLSMRQRCRKHPYYVARKITIYLDWLDSFEAFLRHVGPAPSEKHTLDRWPNAEGHYEPGNVRWATMLEQRHNRRHDAGVGRPWLGKKRPDQSGAANASAKLTELHVRGIRASIDAGERVTSVAKRYGVSRQTITNITSGRAWSGVE